MLSLHPRISAGRLRVAVSSRTVAAQWSAPYDLPSAGNALAIESGSGFQGVRPGGFSASEFAYSLFGSYGSGVFAEHYSAAGAYVFAGTGGHGHPDVVDLVGFDFETGAWFRTANANGAANDSTSIDDEDTSGSIWYEINGVTEVPAPGHGYNIHVYVPPANGGGTKGSIVHAVRNAVSASAFIAQVGHRLDLASVTYSRASSGAGSLADTVNSDYSCALDPTTSRIYVLPRQHHSFTSLSYLGTASVGAYSTIGTYSAPPDTATDGCSGPAAITVDNDRRLILLWLQRKIRALDLTNVSAGWQLLTLTNASTLPDAPLSGSLPVWHAGKGAYYHMPSGGGSTLYKITPPASSPLSNAWVISSESIGGDTIHPKGNNAGDADKAHKSLMYVPAIDRLAWVAGGTTGGTVRPVTLINPS